MVRARRPDDLREECVATGSAQARRSEVGMPEQVFKEAHDPLGSEGSGETGSKELEVVTGASGVEPKEETQQSLSSVDGDGSGTIRYEEFFKAVLIEDRLRPADLSEQQEFMEACVLFGTYGSGEVGSKELEVAMRALGFGLKNEGHQEMAPDVDYDRIGTIGYEEIPKMTHKILDRAQDGFLRGSGSSRHACASLPPRRI